MAAVSLRLPDDVSERLAALARSTGRSKTYYMIEAIREHLGDLEDYYIAEQRMADLEAGRSSTISLEELMKEYDVED